ncbi:hypothetical protein [Xanthomonas translucens]|uniref:Uncharacterized protein n=2 Tax=Xanthomonas campestris pv. translucens TaxID=343 RepID=A0A120EZ73_XANCT|nr:hypothetical protein [Xanthomonas translucens]KWV17181.1 hypothetical protein ATB53_00440 [Xanthomonas translucens]QSQ34658.1 hypothetical protein ISN31_03265 [Xanthomonas translucens pv. translucens]
MSKYAELDAAIVHAIESQATTTRDPFDAKPASSAGAGRGLVDDLVQVMNAEYDGIGRLPAHVLGILNTAVEALAAPVAGEAVLDANARACITALLANIEDVTPDEVWEAIDSKLWNAVSTLATRPQPAPAAAPVDMRAELQSIVDDANGGPRTGRAGCCVECNRWTPQNHPEAHEHHPNCPELAEWKRRHNWRARIADLLAAQPAAQGVDLEPALKKLIKAGRYMQNRVVETRGVKCMDDLDVALRDAEEALIASENQQKESGDV